MTTLFDSEHPTGEGSPGHFRIEGENYEYEDFMGDKFPTAPPDLPNSVLEHGIRRLMGETSFNAEQNNLFEKKSLRDSHIRYHKRSKSPNNTEIIDLDSLEPSNQHSFWNVRDFESEIAKIEEPPIIIVDDIPPHTIKTEDAQEPFIWRDMGSKAIELFDSDDETAGLPRSDLIIQNSQTIKSRSKISALLSSAARARDSPIDNETMLEIQRKYIERALDKTTPSGTGAVFKAGQPLSGQSVTDGEEDQHAWMKAIVDYDTDAAATFVSPGFIHRYVLTHLKICQLEVSFHDEKRTRQS